VTCEEAGRGYRLIIAAKRRRVHPRAGPGRPCVRRWI